MSFSIAHRRPRRAPRAEDVRQDPLSATSLSALRLLVGFVLWADETASARPVLLDLAGARDVRPCQVPFRVLAALRRSPAVRGALDGILASSLARRAAPLAGGAPSELAAVWRAERDRLAGAELAAFLWHVSRSPGRGFRLLEAAIVGRCGPTGILRDRVVGRERCSP